MKRIYFKNVVFCISVDIIFWFLKIPAEEFGEWYAQHILWTFHKFWRPNGRAIHENFCWNFCTNTNLSAVLWGTCISEQMQSVMVIEQWTIVFSHATRKKEKVQTICFLILNCSIILLRVWLCAHTVASHDVKLIGNKTRTSFRSKIFN